MPYQVATTDTGQFVWTDLATDTVVIDDDLAAGYDKLERSVAQGGDGERADREPRGAGEATAGSSVFSFRGGPRYTPILLAVVLPFAWLAVFYFALADLLAEYALDRRAHEASEKQIEELEHEVQALRSEIAGAPRTAKTKAKAKSTPKANTAKPAIVEAPSRENDDDDEAEEVADERAQDKAAAAEKAAAAKADR